MGTAFDKLGASTSLTVRFSLDATPAQLLAMDKLEPSGTPATAADAKAISGLGASLTLSADKPLKDVLDAEQTANGRPDPSVNLDFEVHTGDGKSLAEIRDVKGMEYLRLDVNAIVRLSGDPAATDAVSGLEQMIGQMPPALAPLKSLIKGKWISIDPKKLDELAKGLDGEAGADTPSAAPSLDSATKNKLVSALAGVFSRDVTLTDKGTVNGRDHVVVEAPARKLVADVQKALAPIAKSIPGVGGSFPTAAPTGVPTGKASADILIDKDGSLSELSMDLGQLDPKAAAAKAQLPASVSFDTKAAATTAPAGAVAFDPSALQDLVKSFLGADPLAG
ncbi:hypothetical protein [Streptacidiphilus cavernicola]|uniref:Uncharacterized protein n=1 Tax=Streptacidiphilus cavernicola TaxID=3342716 RepID=A0ABV6W2Y7_9ACTN